MKNIFGVGIIIVLCVLMTGCVTTTIVPNSTELNSSVSGRSPLAITYFYSPSCEWCNKMSVDFDNLTKYHSGEFILTKYNVDIEKDKFNEAIVKYNGSGYYPFVIIGNMTFTGYGEDRQFEFEKLIVNRI